MPRNRISLETKQRIIDAHNEGHQKMKGLHGKLLSSATGQSSTAIIDRSLQSIHSNDDAVGEQSLGVIMVAKITE